MSTQFFDQSVVLATGITEMGKEADAQVNALASVVNNQEQIIETLTAERDEWKAKYEATLPSYRLNLGYCPDPNTPSEVSRLCLFNGGNTRRSYKKPGDFPLNPTFLGDRAAGLKTAHTIKGPGGSMTEQIQRALTNRDRSAWKSYLRLLQKGSVVSAWHEPENDPISKQLWKEGQKWFSALVDEVNAEFGLNLRVAGNLMSSTDSQAEIADWYPGDGVWDILGFDGYNWPTREAGIKTAPRWVEFEEIFTPDWQRCKELGVRFAIFEFGCRKADFFEEVTNNNMPTPENSERQVDWMIKARKVMDEKFKPALATYFHHDWWLMLPEGHEALKGV